MNYDTGSYYGFAQVIFGPATYPQDSLPEGMILDTINARVYVLYIFMLGYPVASHGKCARGDSSWTELAAAANNSFVYKGVKL